jgi:SAM-dependent methyltransferase
VSDEDSVLRAYYEAWAPDFDEAYAASPFALWMESMVADLRAVVRGRRTLEIACGTGFWTALAAEAAAEIVACDTSPAMLALAGERLAAARNVALVAADAYRLDGVGRGFEAAFALQWLSHVPQRRLHEFLENLHSRLRPGAVVFLADNKPVRGSPEARPGTSDTFERRAVRDGRRFEIVKNYPTRAELETLLAPFTDDLTFVDGEYWWWLTYRAGTRSE